MSDLIEDIQYSRRDYTLEYIASRIKYSRPYLNSIKNKPGSDRSVRSIAEKLRREFASELAAIPRKATTEDKIKAMEAMLLIMLDEMAEMVASSPRGGGMSPSVLKKKWQRDAEGMLTVLSGR